MKKYFPILILTYLIMACNTNTTTQQDDSLKVEPAQTPPPMVGNDADEHGCKASAGYRWSVLRNECIRIFEAGVRLDPVAKDLEQSLSAFVVTDSSDQEIELFVPYDEQTIIVKKEATDKWKNDKYVLTKVKETYSIEDANKKLLYKGTIEK